MEASQKLEVYTAPEQMEEFFDHYEIDADLRGAEMWDVPCPWDDKHTEPGKNTTSVRLDSMSLATFKCVHPCCASKGFGDYQAFFAERFPDKPIFKFYKARI